MYTNNKTVQVQAGVKILKSIAAVAWDLDGVIADTQKIHAQVEAQILFDGYGIQIDPNNITERFAGVNTKQVLQTILVEHQLKPDKFALDKLLTKKWERMLCISQSDIVFIPYALQIIQKFHQLQIPQSVASSSKKEFIQLILDTLDVKKYFSFIVSGEEVPSGKPAPDIFLKVASTLSMCPACCLVIEDGVAGVHAAKAAGMKVVFLGQENPQLGADIIVTSFSDVEIE